MTTTRNIFQQFIRWLVLSSQNPLEVGLSVQGALVAAIPTVILVAGFTHYSITPDQLNTLTQNIVLIVQDALFAVAAAIGAYGMIRKILASANGTNLVNLIPPGTTVTVTPPPAPVPPPVITITVPQTTTVVAPPPLDTLG